MQAISDTPTKGCWQVGNKWLVRGIVEWRYPKPKRVCKYPVMEPRTGKYTPKGKGKFTTTIATVRDATKAEIVAVNKVPGSLGDPKGCSKVKS